MEPKLPDFLNSAPCPELDDGHVLVWSGSLDLAPQALETCASILSPDELDRAARFKFEQDSNHFVAARGMLRFFLGFYTRCSPSELEFTYGDKGKPELIHASDTLKFNVSHSHGIGAWALGLVPLLGVDVEWNLRKLDFDRVGKRFFSENEWASLANLSAAERRAGFFNCWTRKEAFVKALGDGLSFSLKAFDVSTGNEAEITRIDGDQDPAKWALHAFEPWATYAGALAAVGQVQFHHFVLTDV